MLSNLDRAGLLRPNIEVVSKPGKEHEQGVLFRKAVIHDRDGSGGPKHRAQQRNVQTEKFPRQPENHDRRQGPKDNIWEADCHFVGYVMRPAQSAVPTVSGG